jgi:hypothetical protein
MAGRSRPTFKKRQRELARRVKQQEKVERRAQRKLEKLSPSESDEEIVGDGESSSGEPEPTEPEPTEPEPTEPEPTG